MDYLIAKYHCRWCDDCIRPEKNRNDVSMWMCNIFNINCVDVLYCNKNSSLCLKCPYYREYEEVCMDLEGNIPPTLFCPGFNEEINKILIKIIKINLIKNFRKIPEVR